MKRITIQVSAQDLARYIPEGTKTGTVNVEATGMTSEGRPVRWLHLGRNGKIQLRGFVGSQRRVWEQNYRNFAPIDD